MKKFTAATAAAGVLIVSAALAGCTGGSTDNQSSSATTSGTVTTQTASSGKTTASNPGKGIISSTTMTSCDKGPGKVNAVGEVTLPDGVDGQVIVSVSWVNPKTSKVVASGKQTLKDLEHGKKTGWKITAEVGAKPGDISCVLGATVLP